jgi:predicted phosphodiesterase
MRAIAIADDDSLVGHLDTSSVDVLISLGDLWDATIESASDRYYPNRIFAVRGNHDSGAPFQPFVTRLHLTVESYFGMTFGGFKLCSRFSSI